MDSPLLPPEPWYKSEVQVRAVIAVAAQLVSILLRVIGRYTEVSITSEQVDLLVADITQAVAVIFGGLAILKRKDSPIQPLTLTANQAKVMQAQSPPVHATDPTKQAGLVRAFMLAAMLLISAPLVVILPACTTLGVPQPQTFNERLAAGYSTVSGVRNAATSLLQAGSISADDAENIQVQADNARAGLDIARVVSNTDMQAADAKLQATLLVLEALDQYLRSK